MASVDSIAKSIREHFPTLNLVVDPKHEEVDWTINIAKQTGLEFDLHLNRQGDELHLSVGGFWLEWFPLSQPDVREQYVDAVIGILSGRYRIIEYVRWGRAVGGELQVPDGLSWKTIGNSSSGILPRAMFSKKRILQNAWQDQCNDWQKRHDPE